MRIGAELFLDCLVREGVSHIFGFPGGVVLKLYDRLMDSDIKHILTRHEQAAAHAADGYSRSTGKVGVCLATSGPGATNLVTGIATAYMDSVPLIAFTGQVSTDLIGGDAFQEADIVGITRPITKHNFLVKDVADLARTIREAFHIARTGRPGPVLVDLPRDMLDATTRHVYPKTVEIRGYNPVYDGNPGQIRRAANLILNSTRPVIYAGGGVIISAASKELVQMAELINIPTTTTLMGLGGFPASHPLFLGMLGMHGTYAANMTISNSDLILAVGARFDDRVTGKIEEFAPNAKIIHIDIDPSAISKNVKVDIPIVGDAKNILKSLMAELKKHPDTKWKEITREWMMEVNAWEKENPLKYEKSDDVLKPQYVVEEIYRLTRGDAIVTTDVGQNQMWTAQYYKFEKPRRLLSSGGLGTMGFGLPAAIGAQVGNPDSLVFAIAGDGSVQMNFQDLITAVQYELPVKVAILNNGYLGMVRQWQELFYDRRYSATDLEVSPDFVEVAKAYGAKGMEGNKPSDVEKIIKEAMNTAGPVVMNFRVNREENVYPMVPAGAGIKDMLLGPPKKK